MRLDDILARLEGHTGTLTFVDDKGLETVRSFGDLYVDTLDLVEQLRQRKVEPGSRIGILAPNGYAWMVWDLAVLALRCVSVALPQEQPKEPLAELMQRYQLTLCAVHAEWLAPDAGCAAFAIGAPESWPAAMVPAPQIEHRAGTHSLVFSSGTTGKTKGLVVSAPGTEHLLNLYAEAFGVERGDRFLTFLPFANYQQRMVYYFCLYHGVDFVSVPFPQVFSGLKKYRPTFTIAPPIFYETLHSLAKAGKPGANTAERLAELTGGRIRYMVTGMAPIKRNTLAFFWEHGIDLYEAFGITEAGMVAWNKPGQVKVGTVGRPAEPGSVSLSEEGEVIVTRPALLSFGYFDASEEDLASTFISPQSVATGDIAELDAEGFLTIVGRKKDAIVTKTGEKFHPEPVESQIQLDPRVKVAVVLGGDNLAGVTALISTDRAEEAQTVQALQAHVERINLALPACQQVKRVVFTTRDFTVENGLRTKNMKLNRKAIHAAFSDQLERRLV